MQKINLNQCNRGALIDQEIRLYFKIITVMIGCYVNHKTKLVTDIVCKFYQNYNISIYIKLIKNTNVMKYLIGYNAFSF